MSAEDRLFKSFSYWEAWPSSTEHAPSLDSFSKLAELYQCAVSESLHSSPSILWTAHTPGDVALTIVDLDERLSA